MPTVKEIETQARAKMENAVQALSHDMSAIRTGRATISILDHIRVDHYGTPTPLNQVANLGVPEPSMITVTPWDMSLLSAIEKSIRNSDIGLNPANDGKQIRLPIPPLTQERRKELVKRLSGLAEDHRVSIRNVRRDANEQLKKLAKDKTIAEDEERASTAEIQKMTDAHIQKLDAAAKAKEKEILAV